MRINKVITKRKRFFDLPSNSLSFFFKEMYIDRSGEFVCRYWACRDQPSMRCLSYRELSLR